MTNRIDNGPDHKQLVAVPLPSGYGEPAYAIMSPAMHSVRMMLGIHGEYTPPPKDPSSTPPHNPGGGSSKRKPETTNVTRSVSHLKLVA